MASVNIGTMPQAKYEFILVGVATLFTKLSLLSKKPYLYLSNSLLDLANQHILHAHFLNYVLVQDSLPFRSLQLIRSELNFEFYLQDL